MVNILSELSRQSPQGAFGDNVNFEMTPVEQVTAQYVINTNKIETFTATGGSADVNNSLFRCQTGTSLGGYGVIRTRRAVVYKAGQGLQFRGTAAFTTGVSLSLQTIGLFALIDGLFFGYYDDEFAVIHRYGGAAEIQRLQITGAAGGSENATVTVDGTGYTVALTSGTVQHNAYEIAESLTSQIGTSWNVEQVDDEVVLVARAVGDKSGSFAFSSSTATGAWTKTTDGVDHTYKRYYFSEVTGQDSINGTTPANFDPTKLNAYRIRFAYLGVANVYFDIYDATNDRWVTAHTLRRANIETTVTVGNPSFFGGIVSASLGSSGTNLTVTSGSMGLFIEGKIQTSTGSDEESATNTAVGTTLENVITIKNRDEYGSRPNIGYVIPIALSGASTSTKNTTLDVLIDADIGEYNYQYVDQTNSIAMYSKTTGNVTGGRRIGGLILGAGGGDSIDLARLNEAIPPNSSITVAAKVSSGSSSEVTASIIWKEDV